MIDIINEKNLCLKNVTQIGTPSEEEKIYIEDAAYARIHMDEFWEQRVFVLMGHTECASGIYTTFIEAAIPVQEIDFEKNTPIWTNRAWSGVFREIKRAYENSIVVGWALDLKGIAPKITPELEAIHREYFGGVHQLFFLANTADREEYFYLNKNNHLYQKDGFYIYYSAKKTRIPQPSIEVNLPAKPFRSHGISTSISIPGYKQTEQQQNASDAASAKDARRDTPAQRIVRKRSTNTERRKEEEKIVDFETARPRGRYREMLMSQQPVQEKQKSTFSATAVALAVVLLAAIVGTAISKNPQQADKVQKIISTISQSVKSGKTETPQDGIIQITTEKFEESEKIDSATESQADQSLGNSEAADQANETGQTEQSETAAETSYIPVEKIDGGIPKEN